MPNDLSSIDNLLAQLSSYNAPSANLSPQGFKVDDLNFRGDLDDDKGFTSNDAFKGISALSSILGAYGGIKQLGLAKDSFNFQKGAFNTNLANQAKLTNSELTDRQNRRVADATLSGNPNSVTSTADYLAQYGVAGKIGG